jgi:hypothetical protein
VPQGDVGFMFLQASGSFTPSYTSDLIQKLDADPGNMSPMEIEHILKWSAGDIFSGTSLIACICAAD